MENDVNEEKQKVVVVDSDLSVMPRVGELVEGTVITMDSKQVFIDLGMLGTGIVLGREFITARDLIKGLNVGDTISGSVVELENDEGYVELSLRNAKQSIVWADAEEAIKEKRSFDIVVQGANKGGLLLEWHGVSGFLPASQLSEKHYPSVESGDKEMIIRELRKLIGEKLSVSIIMADPKDGKLIFTETNSDKGISARKQTPDKYSVGDVFECEVSGIVDFGIFLRLEEGAEGLVHLSEMDWSLVENPRTLYKVGDKVKAKIIGIENGKVSFSIKALTEDPWIAAANKYSINQKVKGVVIKHHKYGALISIEQGVAGLVHVSEFESDAELKKNLELGKIYEFKIKTFEPSERKMIMSVA